jgi:hypothetical protein
MFGSEAGFKNPVNVIGICVMAGFVLFFVADFFKSLYEFLRDVKKVWS